MKCLAGTKVNVGDIILQLRKYDPKQEVLLLSGWPDKTRGIPEGVKNISERTCVDENNHATLVIYIQGDGNGVY